jgi:ABC-2 type transport system permease protein
MENISIYRNSFSNRIKNIFEVTRAECSKMFNSKIFLITIIASILMPFMAGFMMFIFKNPELSRNIGLLGKEATLEGTPDWSYYFSLLNRVFSGGMFLIVYGIIISWVFGREYSNHTIKDLLALPISRVSIVISKFITTVIWCTLLFLIAFLSAILIGHIIYLNDWSINLMFSSLLILFNSALMAILLTTFVAFIASCTKGYLAPIGFIVLVLVLGNLIAGLGYIQFYPWGIPMLYASKELVGEHIGVISIILPFVIGLIGFVATYIWWRYVDQN